MSKYVGTYDSAIELKSLLQRGIDEYSRNIASNKDRITVIEDFIKENKPKKVATKTNFFETIDETKITMSKVPRYSLK